MGVRLEKRRGGGVSLCEAWKMQATERVWSECALEARFDIDWHIQREASFTEVLAV